MDKQRCRWCKGSDIYTAYHDEEWGVPVHDDRTQFEFLILEGAQAGLSWITILKRREAYREAFYNFDVQKVAHMSDEQLEDLRENGAIIRNKLKIYATRNNAQRFIEVQEEFGSFDKYIWSFVNGKTIVNQHQDHTTIPATSPESDALAKDLKKRGFKFCGSTIMYAHMQAAGLINDHITSCFRYKELT